MAVRDPAAVALLLEAGADPSISKGVRNRYGYYEGLTALDIARKHDLGDFAIKVMENALVQGNR